MKKYQIGDYWETRDGSRAKIIAVMTDAGPHWTDIACVSGEVGRKERSWYYTGHVSRHWQHAHDLMRRWPEVRGTKKSVQEDED